MPVNQSSKQFSRFFWFTFVILTVSFYFFGLNIPLLGPDEPRYAQVAREMFERGDWITPTLGGHNWFEKPSLLYWLQIISYSLFGVSEFAARFGSAIFGLATVVALSVLGHRIERKNPEYSGLGKWLAVVAASTIGIIVFSRGASFDIILTFPVTAALVSFYVYEVNLGNRRLALILFYFFLGLAVLAKGLVGIVLPIGVVGSYYVLAQRLPSPTFLLSLVWGLLLTLVVALSWYLPMYIRHGYGFIDEFFIQHHFQRFTSNKYQHPQPFHFFFWVLPLMTVPWLPFFAAGIWRAFKAVANRWFTANEPRSNPFNDLLLFALAWTLVPVLFFSASGSKLPGYVLPSMGGAVILAAVVIFELANRRRYFALGAELLAVSLFIVLAIALLTVVPDFAEADSVKSLITAADTKGHSDTPVICFHTLSHNAEFYAAGRLLRDSEGRQRKINSLAELNDIVAAVGGRAVVLTPIPYTEQLKSNSKVNYEFLSDNGELAAAYVSIK